MTFKRKIKLKLTLIIKRSKPVEQADQSSWNKKRYEISSESSLICTVLKPRVITKPNFNDSNIYIFFDIFSNFHDSVRQNRARVKCLF
jgi:hypothetical protein